MFSNLKDKLLNVNLFSSSEGKNVETKDSFNVNAGIEVLMFYQQAWEEVHNTNVKNAEKAEKIAVDVDVAFEKVKSQKENLELLTQILSTSSLTANITSCLNSINDLYTKSQSVEADLLKLENLIEEIGFENLKNRHTVLLEQYKKRKEESFEKFRVNLEENHAKKLAEDEDDRKLVQKERQKVFQDAFKDDMEMYKSMGTIPRININQNSALLEEIQIDYDQTELDQFFNDS